MKNYRKKNHCQFQEDPCSPAAWSIISYCSVSHWTWTPELNSCVWPIHLPKPTSVLVALINCQVILFPTSSTANPCNKSYTKQMCHTHKLEAKLELQTMPVNFSVERGPVKDKMAKEREKNPQKTHHSDSVSCWVLWFKFTWRLKRTSGGTKSIPKSVPTRTQTEYVCARDKESARVILCYG